MKRKITMLLTALFLVMGTAWAQTSYTIDPTTGTANKTGYFATWTYTTSDAKPATLTLAVQGGANNMKYENNQLQLWVGSGCTYTLSVPHLYRIVSYSFDFVRATTDYNSNQLTLTVDGKTYNPTDQVQHVEVNNVDASSTTFGLTGVNKGIAISNFVVNVDYSFEVTTDQNNPIWHTIKNVRGNVYAYYNGVDANMGMTGTIEKAAYLFYFTEGDTPGTFKIHNAVNSKLCAAPNSWTDSGIDWYIKLSENTSHPGWAISKEETLTGTGGEAWNDNQNAHTSVAWYGGNDAGSTWQITRYEYESILPTVQLSTGENIVLHYIRSQRRDSYVNFDGHNSTFKEGNEGPASYWYFVQDEEAQKSAPEGLLACRIFNAAYATGVENHSSGYMGDTSYPAKIYYIGTGEKNRNGYYIRYSTNATNGWHDYSGTHVGDYGLGDDGSYWRIYPVGKTVADVMSEAATAKTNALNKIANVYEAADYYNPTDEAIATAREAINALTSDNLLNATSGWITINAKLAALASSEKGTMGPAAGDYIRLRNKANNKYLIEDNANNAKFADAKDNTTTLWKVVEGNNGGVRLQNYATNNLLGNITQSTAVKTHAADAAEGPVDFEWANQTETYAVFKPVGGGSYQYGHFSNGNLVGWLASAEATQWVVSQAYPLTVVFKYKGEDIAEHSVSTIVDANTTYTITNPYADTKTYIAIGECSATGNQPVNTDGVWSVKVTEATTVTVTLVDDLPFKVSESYGTATWYFMNIRSNDKKYVAMSDATEYSNTKNSPDEKGLWAFMGDANGIKVINKAAGEGKTLSYEGDAAGGKAVVMREEEKTWTIERANTGFLLRAGNTGNLYVHDLSGKLKIWDSNSAPTDPGSAFNVIEDKGVKDLEELALNPRYIDIYTIQAERSPLMYSATETTKLSSGLLDGVAASETDINQQFLILRSGATPEGYFYLYSLGAEKFVDENLNFIDYPSPVFSLEDSEHAVYPWRVKIDNKYVIPGNVGTDGNKLYHTPAGDDDDGKRYRIVKVGESYEHYNLLTKIEEAEDMIKLPSALSLDKVYTVSTYDEGYWYYNSEQEALWSTEKAGVEPNSQDINQQFAFLTVAGHTYLYSMGAQKFVIKSGDYTAYSEAPSQAIELLDAEGSRFYPFVAAFVNGEERHYIGISNGYEIPVITFHNDLNDHGNKIKLREVTPGYMPGNAAELLAAAVTKIDNYLAAQELKPELEALLAQAQALLDKNYLDEEDVTSLTSAKNEAQTVYDATSNSTELNKQIDLLTEAIAATTTVRTVADFQNNYVYTLVSPRGWLGAADDKDNVISANNGTADDDNFHWAVYKSEGGKYYLYNVGKEMFMGAVSSGDLPFAAKPQSTELAIMATGVAAYPIMFSTDGGSSSVNHENSEDEVINATVWGSGCSYSTDEGNTHKVTVAGQIDANVLAAIKGAVDVLEATQALGDAIAAVQAKADNMDKLGYYSSSNENFTAEFNDVKAFKDAITEGTTLDAINDQITAANNLVATFTDLNVPQDGKFYRIKNNGETGYLSSGTGTGRTQFVANLGESASSIFCYCDGKLLSYENGMYLGVALYGSKNFVHYTNTVGSEVGTTFAFKESPVLGKLLIEFDGETRSFYSAGTGDSNAASNGQTTDSYRFTVEEVTSLPVNVTAARYATLYAPVALEIPENVTVYTASVEDNYLDLTALAADDIIPANTGVIIEAAQGTYNFDVVVSDATIEGNALTGKYAKSEKNADPNTKVYTLQNGSNGVGFYLFKGEDANGNTTYINGFRAWVELPAESGAQALRIRKGGEGSTDIQEIDIEESATIYDLLGRRIEKMDKAGIYIMNGRKVVIK